MQVHYLEIVTTDVAATCAAYAAALNLPFGEPEEALGHAKIAPLRAGGFVGVRAPLHETEEPVVRPYWLVENVETALASAVAAGGEIVHPPLAIEGRGWFAIYALGGNHHGLWQL